MLVASARPAGVKLIVAVCSSQRCWPGDEDWVLGDAHRVQQVVTNVITNAVKHTRTKSIVLSIKWKWDMVRFECLDDGPGISKEDQVLLLARYSSAMSNGAPGTGVGPGNCKAPCRVDRGFYWL
jgi:signal transduction histidine kinase